MTVEVPIIPLAPRRPKADLGARSDDELMRLSGAGVLDAFAELVTRHEASVRAFCARTLAGAEHGDDLAQEVFLEIWRSAGRYQAQGRFRSYLFTSARNRCLRALRDRSRRPQLLPEPLAPIAACSDGDDQLNALLAAERRKRIEQAIARLPAKLREALWLRFAGELDYSEIAAIVRKPEPTIRSRVFLALKRMRDWLGDDAQNGSRP